MSGLRIEPPALGIFWLVRPRGRLRSAGTGVSHLEHPVVCDADDHCMQETVPSVKF